MNRHQLNPYGGGDANASGLFDINALNNMALGEERALPPPSIISVNGLTQQDCANLTLCFERPACSETIFILECFLGKTNTAELEKALYLFGLFLKRLGESREAKSQETLASIGIYFSLFLRRCPNLNVYIENEHFIVRAQRAYYPYIALYVIHFLIPAVIKGVDLDVPFDPRHEVQVIYEDPQHRGSVQNREGSEGETSPERSPPRQSYLNGAIRDLPHRNPQRPDRGSSDPNTSPERNRALELQVRSRIGLGERMEDYEHAGAQPHGIQKVSVIAKIINICPLNSPERKILGELRRQRDTNPSYLITRLGLKSEKLQFALYLDDPSLIDESLNDDHLDNAIFLHANKILTTAKCSFLPHHFDRAVQCMNFDMVRFTASLSDWVSDNTLDELIFLCKTLKHAYCLEILKVVVKKKVTLCVHQIKKLPEEWKQTILSIYTTPRWKHLMIETPVDQESLSREPRNSSEDRAATLDYYRLVFSSLKPRRAFLQSIQDLSVSLADEDQRKAFVDKIKASNESYYKLIVSSYTDLLLGINPTIVNQEDSYLNNIFEIPRNFVIPCLEGTQLFLFDHGMARKLIDTECNFYNRNHLSSEVLAHVRESYGTYNRLGLSSRVDPISEVLAEVVCGRQLEESCSCASKKSYAKKLVRLLRHYSVKEKALDVVNLQDLIVKLGMISIHLGAQGSIKDLPQLWRQIYFVIKTADPDQCETLKRTIATLILVYSRGGGGFIIHY